MFVSCLVATVRFWGLATEICSSRFRRVSRLRSGRLASESLARGASGEGGPRAGRRAERGAAARRRRRSPRVWARRNKDELKSPLSLELCFRACPLAQSDGRVRTFEGAVDDASASAARWTLETHTFARVPEPPRYSKILFGAFSESNSRVWRTQGGGSLVGEKKRLGSLSKKESLLEEESLHRLEPPERDGGLPSGTAIFLRSDLGRYLHVEPAVSGGLGAGWAQRGVWQQLVLFAARARAFSSPRFILESAHVSRLTCAAGRQRLAALLRRGRLPAVTHATLPRRGGGRARRPQARPRRPSALRLRASAGPERQQSRWRAVAREQTRNRDTSNVWYAYPGLV